MKEFISFVKKEFIHIFRDKRSLLILFAIPLIQLLLFGFALRNEIREDPIGILNHSYDETTQKFIHKLTSSGYFKIIKIFSNESEFDEEFRKGKLKEIIVFDKDFSKNLIQNKKANVQLIFDSTDPNFASQIKNYTNSILTDFAQNYSTSELLFDVNFRLFYNPELKSVFMFVPGLMAMILMLLSAFMTSISITREKELGTMEILLASPLTPLQIILGKVIPYVILSFLNAMIILIFSIYIFGMPVSGSFILLISTTTIFIASALSLGLVISSIAETQQVAMLMSLVGLMLPTMLLSDFVFPIKNMPAILQLLSNVVPARWFVNILKGIMLKGLGFWDLLNDIIILSLMTIVLLVISIKKFKIRL